MKIRDKMKIWNKTRIMEENNKKINSFLPQARIRSSYLSLFLFSFISLFYATDCGYFGTYLKNGVCVPDLLVNLSNILILTFILVAAAFYMVGIALEHTRIIQWSKDLLYQLLGTAVILMIYLGIVGTLDQFAPALLNSNLAYPGEPSVRGGTGGGWVSLNHHVERYNECLINYTKESVKKIILLSSHLSVLGSTSINLEVSGYNQFFPVFATGGGFSSIMPVIVGALASTLIQLRLQLEILKLYPALFSIILPLGLVFRSFPYTRAAGAAMIAIVIGFTIFLPIFYLIIEDIGYHSYKVNVCTAKPPSFSFPQLVGIGLDSARNGALKALEKYFGRGGEFEGLVQILVIQATILPLVAYLVVLNITKRISEILGGEIDFSTLVRLI